MSTDPRHNDAQISDGMGDVMAGSSLAFMAVSMLMMLALLAVLLIFNTKDQQASQAVEREAELQQQVESLQEQLAQAQAQAAAAKREAAAARARAQSSQGQISAGYTLQANPRDTRTVYLTEYDDGSCKKPIKIEYVCDRPGSRDPKEFVCSNDGQFTREGGVPKPRTR